MNAIWSHVESIDWLTDAVDRPVWMDECLGSPRDTALAIRQFDDGKRVLVVRHGEVRKGHDF